MLMHHIPEVSRFRTQVQCVGEKLLVFKQFVVLTLAGGLQTPSVPGARKHVHAHPKDERSQHRFDPERRWFPPHLQIRRQDGTQLLKMAVPQPGWPRNRGGETTRAMERRRGLTTRVISPTDLSPHQRGAGGHDSAATLSSSSFSSESKDRFGISGPAEQSGDRRSVYDKTLQDVTAFQGSLDPPAAAAPPVYPRPMSSSTLETQSG
ncbi:unnamed protein product [Pleuronectes platessa]|uniref:Uncharacterized protein n=1 Tax=Pleuronectes platessa TaxID=8262 RepID=A0A9N7TUC4_PLEPL|nr:unnamed protein product [Pleuronectes platessa]